MAKSQYTVLGIDLNDYNIQAAIYRNGMDEPVSVSQGDNEEDYTIPSVICKKDNEPVWLIGEEAKQAAAQGKGREIRKLVSMIDKDETYDIDEAQYSTAELVRITMSCLLDHIRKMVSCETFSYICVTMESLSKRRIDYILKAFSDLGYKEEQVRVISHTESFVYYTLCQPKELRTNDVVLYDFTQEHFTYRRINISRGTTPTIIQVDTDDYTEEIPYDMVLSTEKEQADEQFMELIRSALKRGIVSTVYLTGQGFFEQWADNSTQVLCSKRRVFLGCNLLVKGAAYAGQLRYVKDYFEDCVFYCEGRTKVDISLLVEHGDKQMPLLLSRAGTNWYEAGAITEGILDQTDQVTFVVTSPITKMSQNYVVDLREFPVRPNKTTRIEINLSYNNEEQCTILIKDKGFGEIFKSSGKSIRKLIKLQNVDEV